MEIINLDNYKEERFNNAVALGNFDGIHIAHKALIDSMINISKDKNIRSAILLFNTHTKKAIGGRSPQLLSSREQKIKILSQMGVDTVYMANFDEELKTLSPEDFVKNILVDKLKTKVITVGFDYRFGYKAAGNIELLKELAGKYNIVVNIINPQYLKDTIISSTEIRGYLKDGLIKEANSMLGRSYLITGKVIHGKSLGRKLGFPTANIELDNEFLIPKSGVYITKTIIDNKEYKSVTSIGINPTFDDESLKIETHIIDFQQNIYDKYVGLKFLDYIRGEIKFNDLGELKEQIQNDVNYVKLRY